MHGFEAYGSRHCPHAHIINGPPEDQNDSHAEMLPVDAAGFVGRGRKNGVNLDRHETALVPIEILSC